MKKNFTLIIMLLFVTKAFSWGGDVLSGPLPSSSLSMVSTSTGVLYSAIPTENTAVAGVSIFSSTDMGISWTPVANPAAGFSVRKAKLVVTGADSVYCAYQVGNNLFFYSVAADVTTPFTTDSIEDFDIASSQNGNTIYLFHDVKGTTGIFRYGSSDGGYTWTGSSASVAGGSVTPRIYMSGTRLILNYRNPVLSDTSTSIIRAAIYDESSPGSLTFGTFQDIVTTTLHHDQYASVIIADKVWFLFTEEDSMQTIKYRVSNDGGENYGTETVLAGNANVNAQCFSACHFTNRAIDGIHVVYYSDSASVPAMNYIQAAASAPTSFSAPEKFNDFTPVCTDKSTYPAVCSISSDAAVMFVQENTTFSAAYFDLQSAILGIENIKTAEALSIYPNPVKSILNFTSSNWKQSGYYLITDPCGRILNKINSNGESVHADVSNLSNGIYFIISDTGKVLKFVKE